MAVVKEEEEEVNSAENTSNLTRLEAGLCELLEALQSPNTQVQISSTIPPPPPPVVPSQSGNTRVNRRLTARVSVTQPRVRSDKAAPLTSHPARCKALRAGVRSAEC